MGWVPDHHDKVSFMHFFLVSQYIPKLHLHYTVSLLTVQ